MAFALKVTKGPGEGTEFPFDQPEAKLGRTADNDIVVKDSSASRSHCKVYTKGPKYFIEDLKSANGTKLNGVALSAPSELKHGDRITIGEVEFLFDIGGGNETLLKAPLSEQLAEPTIATPGSTDESEAHSPAATTNPEPEAEAEEPVDPNATLLKPPKTKDVERNRPTARRPPPAKHDTQGEIGTVGKGTPLQDENAGSTMEVAVPPPVSLAKVGESTVNMGLKRAAKAVDDEPAELTAADRLRKRREQQKTALGRIAMQWGDLPLAIRIVAAVLGGALVLGSLGFLVVSLIPKNTGPAKVEPNDLEANAPPLKDSFGTGDEVTWNRPDMKIFNFSLASPTQVVAVLHYGAKDISKDEVTITLNGAEVGTVPPDTIDTSREIEVVFPPNIVKAREQNQLAFDSVKNPPGNDPWRVFNIWVEIIPIPDLSPAETSKLSRDNIQKADRLFEMRDIGPENLFKAWKTYREAWLLMESLPDKSQVQDVYTFARAQMRMLRPMLDQKCNALMVEYQKAINARPPNLKGGIQILKDVERYFPTREHPCYGFSKALLADQEVF